MTDKKISELDPASALAGTEEIPVVQSAATVRSTPAAIKTYLFGAVPTGAGSAYAGVTADWGSIADSVVRGVADVTTTTNSAVLGAGDLSSANIANVYAASRGTLTAPTTVVNGDGISSNFHLAYDGANYVYASVEKIEVAGTVSAGSVPTDRIFYAGGSAGGLVEAGRIKDNGTLQWVKPVTATSVTASLEDAGTTTVLFPAKLTRTSSGTPANGIGVGMQFEVETSAGNNEIGATVRAIAEDTTSTSEDFGLSVSTMVAGSTTLVESARFVNGRIYNYGLGTAALPAYSFDIGGNRAYGMWYGSNSVCFSANATQVLTLNAGGVEVNAVPLLNYKESVSARTTSGSEGTTAVGGNISTTTTNTGASALITRTLPAATTGLVYRYGVTDTDGIKVQTGTGDTIRVTDKVTAATGYIQATALGSYVEVSCLEAGKWMATKITGVWTDGTFTYDDTSLTTP